MADRQAILDVLSALALFADRHEPGEVAARFTKGGVLTTKVRGTIERGPFVGRDDIRERFARLNRSSESHGVSVRHLTTNTTFLAESESCATVISYVTLILTDETGPQIQATGEYHDDFVLEDGTWLVAERVICLDSSY